jgi:hypothetical protein
MGENICKLYIRQESDKQNIQGAQNTKFPKINDPVKTWTTELNGIFPKEEVQAAKNP